ncbi:hypothetical protein GUJ93_ZPchr0006g40651 [Zizania palustris]|uniref:Cyclin N-terminal domain-containing protein n=1 Tax=Zizania palustris TaxID=103762 RepID=A0A8J5W2T3_ZIZPA|nr:hypothetical protein GUJ93_ZPchr0006g40651 [Zizania palustris]
MDDGDADYMESLVQKICLMIVPRSAAPSSDGGAASGAAAAAVYEASILENQMTMEMDISQRPSPDYLSAVQRNKINPAMRASVVVWMDEMSRGYKLADGTLHRAVCYIDRYLSSKPLEEVSPRQLGLLAATAVFLAAKYENDFTAWKLDARVIAREIGSGLYTPSEVLKTERDLLAALDYKLGHPTALTFVDHYLARNDAYYGNLDGSPTASLARHLADLTLLDYRSLRHPPSAVAASAVHLARCATIENGRPPPAGNPPSYAGLEEVTLYRFADLAGCIEEMYDIHESQCWPGYGKMKARYGINYSLPARRCVLPLNSSS